MLHHPKQLLSVSGGGVSSGGGPVTSVSSSVPSLPAPAALSTLSSGVSPAQNKKYRPPHKTEKFTPKPIPPELGNLKTYSKYRDLPVKEFIIHCQVTCDDVGCVMKIRLHFYSQFWKITLFSWEIRGDLILLRINLLDSPIWHAMPPSSTNLSCSS